MMRIAIIGAGNVGSALGRGWLRAGEDVVFGVPNPADPKYNPLPRERLLTLQEAARNAQTVVPCRSTGPVSGSGAAGTSSSMNVRPDEAEVHAVSMSCGTAVVSHR